MLKLLLAIFRVQLKRWRYLVLHFLTNNLVYDIVPATKNAKIINLNQNEENDL